MICLTCLQLFIFINIGTDKYATPAKHTNTTPSEEHATPSEEEEEEILCIEGIQAEIEGCFSGAGARNKLRTHVTPQVEKWSATPDSSFRQMLTHIFAKQWFT